MEKIGFSSFVSVMYRDHEADMTDIALFFDRTDSIAGILGSPEDVPPVVRDQTRNSNGYSEQERAVCFFKEEVENTHGRFPCVSR